MSTAGIFILILRDICNFPPKPSSILQRLNQILIFIHYGIKWQDFKREREFGHNLGLLAEIFRCLYSVIEKQKQRGNRGYGSSELQLAHTTLPLQNNLHTN